MSNSIRIIYGCPIGNTPAGGVKVIYRHSELLSQLGHASSVWHPGNENFRCDWFDSKANTIPDSQLSPSTDLIVLPEIWATGYMDLLKNLGFKVAIFVQNGYYTHVNLNTNNPQGIRDAYLAADLILSISSDTSLYLEQILQVPKNKIVLQRYSVDPLIFKPHNKQKIISYMPRKMAQHSVRFVSAITPLLPNGWTIQALDKMSESDIAHHLSQSIIFAAFSEFEGLPVPPVEAALSGNIVIGYHGQGGREYWKEPNFFAIEQGDLQAFITKTLQQVNAVESGVVNLNELNEGIRTLSQYFSKDNEKQMLQELMDKSEAIFNQVPSRRT